MHKHIWVLRFHKIVQQEPSIYTAICKHRNTRYAENRVIQTLRHSQNQYLVITSITAVVMAQDLHNDLTAI